MQGGGSRVGIHLSGVCDRLRGRDNIEAGVGRNDIGPVLAAGWGCLGFVPGRLEKRVARPGQGAMYRSGTGTEGGSVTDGMMEG